MPRQKPTDRIEALRQKRAQLDAQLKAAEARATEQARKEDTRRKVIAGALALEHMSKNPNSEFAKIMGKLLDEYVRTNDRYLFPSLPTKPETEQASVDPAPTPAMGEVAAE
ncbi:MAG: hypothetical protein B7W99_00870 [Rhodospirillales bacterium 20-58-10]|nr:MAG: hypothetical protein B7W99_00870 [Rhodospirillales bacterium 20-58-10]